MMQSRTNTKNPVSIRKMELSDTEDLMRLKNAEGWNQTEKDWALLIQYRASVNLVAVLDKQIVGTVCAINYANTVAWIGMMLVDKEFRGRGISKLLLREAINKLDRCASIKLDATPAGKPVYLKLGFKDETILYRMVHPSVQKISKVRDSDNAVQILPEDLPEVIEYDKTVFGADRSALIKILYENYPELAFLIRENNKVIGFCLGRRGARFTQIGPVFAGSTEGAQTLIQSVSEHLSGQAVVVDIHANKPSLKAWLEGQGFVSQRPFDRMYLDQNPHPGTMENQYLISGPELG